MGPHHPRGRHQAAVGPMAHPYSTLDPDAVLDALDTRRPARRRAAAGPQQLREPRLPGLAGGRRARVVVEVLPARAAGATRRSSRSTPSRTSSRQREIPVVAPLALDGARCTSRRLPLRGLPAPRRPRARARRPERARMDRPLPRRASTPSGATRPFAQRPALDIAELRRRAARLAARARLHPAGRAGRLEGGRASRRCRRRRAARFARRRRRPKQISPARRLPPRQHPVDRRTTRARTSSTSTTRAWGRRCRTCGCCCRAIARSARRAAVATCSRATSDFASSTGASCTWSRRCARCA